MAVVQGGYVRRIPQGKEKATILRGLLIIVPSFAIIGFAQSKVHYYILHPFSVSSKVVVIVCVSLFFIIICFGLILRLKKMLFEQIQRL